MMKDSVVIINTARGGVIDEAALVDALDSGKVWSVGLDVFEDEPNVHPGLLKNPRVTLLPHMGTWTVEVSPFFPLPSSFSPSSSSFALRLLVFRAGRMGNYGRGTEQGKGRGRAIANVE